MINLKNVRVQLCTQSTEEDPNSFRLKYHGDWQWLKCEYFFHQESLLDIKLAKKLYLQQLLILNKLHHRSLSWNFHRLVHQHTTLGHFMFQSLELTAGLESISDPKSFHDLLSKWSFYSENSTDWICLTFL